MKIGPLEVEIWLSNLRVWRLRPILGGGGIKRAAGPPRSENSMPPGLKLNFGPSGMYMQIFMLLSQSAQISCLFTTLEALAHTNMPSVAIKS